MIPLRLAEIAAIVDGTLSDPTTAEIVVSAPAVIDSRAAEPGGLFVAFAGEHVDGHEYADAAGAAGAVAAIGTRTTTLPTVIVEDPQLALQRLAAAVLTWLRSSGEITVFGLTGSQGKTSTKDMLAAILTATGPTVATLGSLNNELGVPLTVLRATEGTRYLVLEMGARGIGHIAELTAIAPLDIAIVLNVGTAHLGEFGSQDAIAQAKGELVEGLASHGTAVLNADDPRVAAMGSRTPTHAAGFITFGASADADVRLGAVELDRLGRPRFELTTPAGTTEVVLPVVGAHQALNAAAATAAAEIVDVTAAEAAAALAGARLSKWRMELTETAGGLTVLNDSYNANPESMRAAIDALAAIDPVDGGRRIAVLGEMRELGEGSAAAHFEVGVHAAARGIDLVLVVGGAAASIEMGARTVATAFVEDNAAAVAWLHEHLTPRDVVLLKASRGARLDEVADALS